MPRIETDGKKFSIFENFEGRTIFTKWSLLIISNKKIGVVAEIIILSSLKKISPNLSGKSLFTLDNIGIQRDPVVFVNNPWTELIITKDADRIPNSYSLPYQLAYIATRG